MYPLPDKLRGIVTVSAVFLVTTVIAMCYCIVIASEVTFDALLAVATCEFVIATSGISIYANVANYD